MGIKVWLEAHRNLNFNVRLRSVSFLRFRHISFKCLFFNSEIVERKSILLLALL